MRAGKDVVSANKQLLSQHGEELFETAREHGVQAALRGGGGRARCRSCACSRSRCRPRRSSASTGSSTARPTSSSPRWRGGSSYARGARRGPAPRLRRGGPERRRQRPRRGGEDGDPRAPGVRHARCTWTTCATRASSTCTRDDLEYARELGLGLKLIGTAERRDGGLSVRVYPTFLYCRASAGLGLGPVQRGHGRVGDDHRDHDVRARARAAGRPRARCSATS